MTADTTTQGAIDFPPRILALLREVACRTPPAGVGPWEDGNGEPLQDDADAALAWIDRRAQAPAPQGPSDAQGDAPQPSWLDGGAEALAMAREDEASAAERDAALWRYALAAKGQEGGAE